MTFDFLYGILVGVMLIPAVLGYKPFIKKIKAIIAKFDRD